MKLWAPNHGGNLGRSNNPSAGVQCPTCGAEPGWRCMVSTGGAMHRNFHKARVRSAAAARAAADGSQQ